MSVHYDREIENLLQQLTTGVPVFTADGERIGVMAETRNRYLKIDAPMRRDFWIDVAFVAGCDEQRVDLTFDKSDLGAYRVADPGVTVGVPAGVVTSDPPPVGNFIQPGLVADPIGAVSEQPMTSGRSTDAMPTHSDPSILHEGDLIVSEREQLEQRMRMEAQLAEQRQKLDHMHPIGEGAPPDTFGTIGEPVETELARLQAEHGPITSSRETAQGMGQNRWLMFVGVAALLGVAGAALMLRRRARSTPRKTTERVHEAVQDLPALAERGIAVAREVAEDLPEIAERGVQAARAAVAGGVDRAKDMAHRL